MAQKIRARFASPYQKKRTILTAKATGLNNLTTMDKVTKPNPYFFPKKTSSHADVSYPIKAKKSEVAPFDPFNMGKICVTIEVLQTLS